MIEKIRALCIKYREIIVYLIVGVLTTIVAWGCKFLFNWIFYGGTALPTVAQNTVLSIVENVSGIAFAYPTNRRWVFQSKNPNILSELLSFIGSRAATWILAEHAAGQRFECQRVCFHCRCRNSRHHRQLCLFQAAGLPQQKAGGESVIRQQIIALFLTASVALPSCGLVKTPAEKVSEQIAALSELSPITEAAILEAEEAFEALSEEEQAEVENADEIAAARERLEEQRISRQKASARDTVAGEWVELDEVLGLSRPIVYWFGPLKLNASGVGESEGSQWTWDVSEDLSEIRLSGNRGKVTLDVIRDGAFTKLRDPNGRYVLVRAEDAESYVKELQAFNATVALINTGGIVASYDTRVEDHPRSEYLLPYGEYGFHFLLTPVSAKF